MILLFWLIGEFYNIPSHGTFSLLIKMEMWLSCPTWGGKIMTRVDLFLSIFRYIHLSGKRKEWLLALC